MDELDALWAFLVAALTAFSNAEALEQQVSEFKPAFAELVRNGGRECLIEAATRDGAGTAVWEPAPLVDSPRWEIVGRPRP